MDVGARRTEYGWSAEFSVPLTSIRMRDRHRRHVGHQLRPQPRRSLEISAGPTTRSHGPHLAGRHDPGLELDSQARKHQIIRMAGARSRSSARTGTWT